MIKDYKKVKSYGVVEFVSTTNPTFQNYAELEGTLVEYEVVKNFNIFYFDSISHYVRTSIAKSVEHVDDIITVHTLNSIYKFKLLNRVDGINLKKKLSQCQQ